MILGLGVPSSHFFVNAVTQDHGMGSVSCQLEQYQIENKAQVRVQTYVGIVVLGYKAYVGWLFKVEGVRKHDDVLISPMDGEGCLQSMTYCWVQVAEMFAVSAY